MKGKTEFVWAPSSMDGAIVSTILWRDDIIIACEYAVYRMSQGPEITVQKIELTEMPVKNLCDECGFDMDSAAPHGQFCRFLAMRGKGRQKDGGNL